MPEEKEAEQSILPEPQEEVSTEETSEEQVEEVKPVVQEVPKESVVDSFLKEKNFQSHDDLVNAYRNLERDKQRLAREITEVRRQQSEANQPKVTVPQNVDDFLREFATNPQETLRKIIKNETSGMEISLRENEKNLGVLHVLSQKDYYEGMIDDITDVIYNYGDTMYSIDGVNYRLRDLPPMHKAQASLQILRGNKQQQVTQQPKPTPPVTVKTAKVASKVDGKSDTILTAAEFAKRYGLKQGEL